MKLSSLPKTRQAQVKAFRQALKSASDGNGRVSIADARQIAKEIDPEGHWATEAVAVYAKQQSTTTDKLMDAGYRYLETGTARPNVKPDDAIGTAYRVHHPKVSEVFAKPSSKTSTTVRFELPEEEGREIKPGERWVLQIPKAYRDMLVRSVILVHRKDDKYAGSYDKAGVDQEGPYNLVTARKTGTQSWVTWADDWGSEKFAERRSAWDPEHENLHDWLSHVGEAAVDLVSIKNVGEGENAVANVHMVEIEFFPRGNVQDVQEAIFTPGTEFADVEQGPWEPTYGGGDAGEMDWRDLKKKGLYPGAIKIGSVKKKKISDDAYIDAKGMLHIKLEPGRVFGGIEVACGDTHYKKGTPRYKQANKDGHFGELGWAKLYGRVRNKKTGRVSDDFIHHMNVPPAGVLAGGPLKTGYVTKPGDEIVLESWDDDTFIMGYRISYMEKGSQ